MPDVASVLEEEELLAKGGREQKIGELKNGGGFECARIKIPEWMS